MMSFNIFAQTPSQSQPISSCEANEAGDFFVAAGDATTYTHEVSITYTLQVQGSVHLTARKMRERTLGLLERGIIDLLLPEFFAPSLCIAPQTTAGQGPTDGSNIIITLRSNCGEENNDKNTGHRHPGQRLLQAGHRHVRKREQSNRREQSLMIAEQSDNGSAITGMLSAPQDEILPGFQGVQCRTGLVDDALRCFVISGGYTLVGLGENLDWAVPLAKEGTREVFFHSGDFRGGNGLLLQLASIDPDILDVRFLDFGNTTTVAVGDPPTSGDRVDFGPVLSITREDNNVVAYDGVPVWAWIMISAAILILPMLAFTYIRWKRRREDSFYRNVEGDVESYSSYPSVPNIVKGEHTDSWHDADQFDLQGLTPNSLNDDSSGISFTESRSDQHPGSTAKATTISSMLSGSYDMMTLRTSSTSPPGTFKEQEDNGTHSSRPSTPTELITGGGLAATPRSDAEGGGNLASVSDYQSTPRTSSGSMRSDYSLSSLPIGGRGIGPSTSTLYTSQTNEEDASPSTRPQSLYSHPSTSTVYTSRTNDDELGPPLDAANSLTALQPSNLESLATPSQANVLSKTGELIEF